MIFFIISLFITSCLGHERHFPNHPEWDNIWPDPFTLNDLRENPQFDRSGIYVVGEYGVLITPSSGGYGSNKGRYYKQEVEKHPGLSYSVRCLQDTCDGWVRARVLIDTVTFFDRNETILTERKFVVNSNGDFHFENGKIWKRCSGDLSGVWWENKAKRSHVVAIGHIPDLRKIRFWGEKMSSVWHLGQGNLQDETIQFSAKSQDFKVKLRVSEKNGDLVLVDSLNRHVFSRKSSKYLWPNRDIKKVHMIFMNHLDIGYTST